MVGSRDSAGGDEMGITWVVPGHHKGHSELRKELGAVAMKGPGKSTAAGSGDEERSPPIRGSGDFQKLEKARKQTLPPSLREDKTLLTLILAQRHVGGASDLHNCKTIDPCCLKS